MKEDKILDEIFELCNLYMTSELEKIAFIDSLLQFSENPTSASAGYAIEENYEFIILNLATRYGLKPEQLDLVIGCLKRSVEYMLQENDDVYFWREYIKDYIKDRYLEDLFKFYDSLLYRDKEKFLFILYSLLRLLPLILVFTEDTIKYLHKWFMCFFDKEEKSDVRDFKDLMIKFGIGNDLFYRSARGNWRGEFILFTFIHELGERYIKEIPVNENQIKEFFDNLEIDDIKLLEKLLKAHEYVFSKSEYGELHHTAPLIFESSRNYSAISPFAIDKLDKLIKDKKIEIIKSWEEKLNEVLNSFVEENYLQTELKCIYQFDGAKCWEIKYTSNIHMEPIRSYVLLTPYIFPSVIEKMRELQKNNPSQLKLIFVIIEKLPAITEAIKDLKEKAIIFIYNNRKQKFQIIENHAKTTFIINEFISKLMPKIKDKFEIEG